jgi:hypothetical protein
MFTCCVCDKYFSNIRPRKDYTYDEQGNFICSTCFIKNNKPDNEYNDFVKQADLLMKNYSKLTSELRLKLVLELLLTDSLHCCKKLWL